MYSDSVLLHHGPFIIPAHCTWPWQVLTQGFSARTRASWCVQFCVWHAVHSVNVCWMQILRDVSYWFVLYLKKEGCPGKEHLVKERVSSGERFTTLEGKYAGKIQSGKNLSPLLPHESVTWVLPWAGSSFIKIELSIGSHEVGYIKCPLSTHTQIAPRLYCCYRSVLHLSPWL